MRPYYKYCYDICRGCQVILYVQELPGSTICVGVTRQGYQLVLCMYELPGSTWSIEVTSTSILNHILYHSTMIFVHFILDSQYNLVELVLSNCPHSCLRINHLWLSQQRLMPPNTLIQPQAAPLAMKVARIMREEMTCSRKLNSFVGFPGMACDKLGTVDTYHVTERAWTMTTRPHLASGSKRKATILVSPSWCQGLQDCGKNKAKRKLFLSLCLPVTNIPSHSLPLLSQTASCFHVLHICA